MHNSELHHSPENSPVDRPILPVEAHSPHSPSVRKLAGIPLSIATALSAVVLVASSATAWWTWQTITAQRIEDAPAETEVVIPTQPAAPPIIQEPVVQAAPQAPSDATVVPQETLVQVYWLKDTGTGFELSTEAISVAASEDPDVLLEGAFRQLLAGPSSTDEVASTIPNTTALGSVEVKPDGVHVDLSGEFTLGGGSASMMGRLGQVVYTATTLDASAPVWITIDGEPLEYLGGEGIIVNQPMTRGEFDQDFSL